MSPTQPAGSSGILVRKYGGSSLATVERLAEVARDIRRARDLGFGVVVVVSAMGQSTDELADLARRVNPEAPRRELDMLLSVGERISMSLLSMALAREECPAISLTGSQCGIITDTSHTDARIIEVKGDRVREALARGCVVVVAGFQGVSREREITTLGRGGSDTTAVALAAALGAVRCEILKDVDGVMSADPSLVPDAFLHPHLSWDQMRRIAATGCGVVHLRAVDYAQAHGVPLVVRSSFHDGPGTTIGDAFPPAPMALGGPAPAAVPVPQARSGRYRPLVMTVAEVVGDLRLAVDAAEDFAACRGAILSRLDPCAVIAEWLDAGDRFRWEALLKGGAADLHAAAAGCAPKVLEIEEGLSCVSLAGGRPDSWLGVQKGLTDILAELGCPPWRMRADGDALRIILRGRPGPDLPARLHGALLAD